MRAMSEPCCEARRKATEAAVAQRKIGYLSGNGH